MDTRASQVKAAIGLVGTKNSLVGITVARNLEILRDTRMAGR